ncbi:bifunctional alpha,alpha-trehalose-phosphate synthase (UDP-forming)/trehalose-phosphatase [Paraflavisolibacter sp. H34]|uniref:bifunctional alpha,alpha-trehalose-phosphate synthase (UDP-forming)/trehalose-phosphatase n=1 Tax=Huijunlia imazamoxiresistens TaxID=3127457 RepID=UPI003017EF71
MNTRNRLFIIANRLPVQVQGIAGEISVQPSAGGLVSAVNSYLNGEGGTAATGYAETFWVGMPCCSPETWTKAETFLEPSPYTFLPVFAPRKTYDGYYNGFSNSVLWPLFHYFPSYAEYSTEDFQAYQQVNAAFAEVIARHARPGDVVWIHDYHLLPLAAQVRRLVPEITIGFFLHIPFPSYELFRMLPRPWQEDLLQGMMGADLVGFHTIDYVTHFLQCVKIILGADTDNRMITYDNRLVTAGVFPISIDFDLFSNGFAVPEVQERRATLKQSFEGKQIIFSVDRLDYTKGVSHRLRAYEHFLVTHPEFREKVVFILVVVPSRDTISRYQERKKLIDELISNINSRVGTLNWQPVIYQYQSLPFEEMLALYTACDLALITPLRDGMNLVAKEFVAARQDQGGVLLLSEMAGAAKELVTALFINPNDVEEIAGKIHSGLTMSPQEQRTRMELMRRRIAHYQVKDWAADFLGQLSDMKRRQQDYQVKFLDDLSRVDLFDKWDRSRRRLILLDYDGTLVPFADTPGQARPGAHLLELLQQLAEAPNNTVCIISGRDSATLDSWLGHLPLNIIAEHGARMKEKEGSWRDRTGAPREWKGLVRDLMEATVQQCPGSFVETKEFSVVWHYRNTNSEAAALRAAELFKDLNEYTHNLGVQVLRGNKMVEVRVYGMNKGLVIQEEFSPERFDFILALGDDRTDEDMFRALAADRNAWTIKIGAEASFARFNLYTPQMVLSLLGALSHKESLMKVG